MIKKSKITLVVVILLISAIGLGLLSACSENDNNTESTISYASMWTAIPCKHNYEDFDRNQFGSYDDVWEEKLQINIGAYNANSDKSLTLDDFKEFFECETNEDGTKRIESGYTEINEFILWAFKDHGQRTEIQDYENAINKIYEQLLQENSKLEANYDFSVEQVIELEHKYADSSYKINSELFK